MTETKIDPTSQEEPIEEELPLEPKEEVEEDEDLEEVEDLDSEEEEEPEEEEEEPEEDPAPKPKEEPAPQPQQPDYKQKFSSSTRRNQIVESQLKELQKTLGDITKQEIPTDEEMTDVDPDWAYRSDFEKNLLIKQTVLDRRQNQILNTFKNITSQSEFTDQLNTFVETKPELKGKEEAFYDFASDPKNKGASMEVLMSAFLFELKEEAPANPDIKPETKKEKPPALNRATPTGGIPVKKEGETYSDEELKTLRTKNPKLYHKLIKEGKI